MKWVRESVMVLMSVLLQVLCSLQHMTKWQDLVDLFLRYNSGNKGSAIK